ncbi:MAG TPA: hypothetical protein VFC56_07650 [Stellaceae bacterium]|nr:hypothetical protein [Stellaceae bacterium]
MSYPSAAPRFHQIDVVDQVGRAYRIVFDNLQLVGELALLPYLIVLGIELVAVLIPGAGFYGRMLAGLIHAVAFLIFGSVFIVRWHRFVLLGESVGGGLIPPGWTDFLLAGVKLAALIFAGWVVLFLIAALPPQILTATLAVVGGFALMLLSLRVSLIFPAAAIERPIGLRTAWDWVQGNFLRLFACALACYLPFIVVQMLVAKIAEIFPSLIWIVFEAIHLAVFFVAAAVAAALLSHLYRDLAGDPPDA